jgi:hypothetical protein
MEPFWQQAVPRNTSAITAPAHPYWAQDISYLDSDNIYAVAARPVLHVQVRGIPVLHLDTVSLLLVSLIYYCQVLHSPTFSL